MTVVVVDYLGLSVNQTDSILIDGDQQKLGVVLVSALLHLEERRTKCWKF